MIHISWIFRAIARKARNVLHWAEHKDHNYSPTTKRWRRCINPACRCVAFDPDMQSPKGRCRCGSKGRPFIWREIRGMLFK